jgi:hypothetical protein
LLFAISGTWTDKAEQRHAPHLGFDHCLRKPCDAGVLVALLNAFQSRARS